MTPEDHIMGQLIGALFFLIQQLPDDSEIDRSQVRRALNKVADYWQIDNTLIRTGEASARRAWLPK